MGSFNPLHYLPSLKPDHAWTSWPAGRGHEPWDAFSLAKESPGGKIEGEISRFVRELLSPLSLASFGAAVGVSRLVALRALSGAGRLNLSTLLYSESLALSAEVPTLVLSRRLGLSLLGDEKDLWSSRSLGEELLATFGPLAMLKGVGNISHYGAPALLTRAGFPGGPASLQHMGRMALATGQVGGEVVAVMAGHGLNRLVGLESPGSPESGILFSSLLTVAHMRLAGVLVDRFFPPSLRYALLREKIRLSLPDWQWAFLPPLAPEGLPAGASRLPTMHLVLMEAKGDSGGGSSKSRPPSSSPKSPTLAELVRSKLAAFLDVNDKSDARGKLAGLAKRMNHLWNELAADPRFATKEEFLAELERVDTELEETGQARKKIVDSLEELRTVLEEAAAEITPAKAKPLIEKDPTLPSEGKKDSEPEGILEKLVLLPVGRALVGIRDLAKWPFFRQKKAVEENPTSQQLHRPTPPTLVPGQTPESGRTTILPGPPAVPRFGEEGLNLDLIRDQIRIKEEEERRLDEIITGLSRLRRLMVVTRMTQQGGERLRSVLEQLDRLMEGRLRWKRPNLREVSGGEGRRESLLRQNGALLGLAVGADWLRSDTQLAQGLRGEVQGGLGFAGIELEILHRGIFTAAKWHGSVQELKKSLGKMLKDYGAQPPTAAAVLLAGETLYDLIHGQVNPDLLMGQLQRNSAQGPLAEAMESLAISLDPAIRAEEGLQLLGARAESPDYLKTGLWTLIRSQGDPEKFMKFMRWGKEGRAPGFHPTVSATFFGAAYGSQSLPKEIFSKKFDPEAYLDKAYIENSESE